MTLRRATMYVNETTLVVNEVLRQFDAVIGYHITEWSNCYCKSDENKRHSYFLCYVKIMRHVYQCQSDTLQQQNYEIYHKVMHLENIRVQQICYDCLPLYLKSHKEVNFKALVNKEVIVGQPMRVSCPGIKRHEDQEIRWVKDNARYFEPEANSLGKGDKERHIGVDLKGEIVISKTIFEDKGIYACFVDGEPLLKVKLKIAPQDVRDTKEFKEGLVQLFFLFGGTFLL